MTGSTTHGRGRWALLAGAAVVLALGAGTSSYVLTGAALSKSSSPQTPSAPPTPTITSGPANPTLLSSVTFAYSDSLPSASFKCSLDGSTYVPCGGGTPASTPNTGSKTYAGLLPDQHCFSVEAVLAVLASSPATYCWQQNGLPFSIGWVVPSSFYPGTSQRANLVVSNPNPKAFTIAKSSDTGGLSVTVTSNARSACPSSNFGVTQGLLAAVTVPAHTSAATLQSLGVPQADWPVVTMFDGSGGAGSVTDQDRCQGVGLSFTFGATASGN